MQRARDRGELLRGEADFQLRVDLPLVRAEDGRRAEAARRPAGRPTRTTRSSSRRSPRCRTSTGTTTRRASRRGARCSPSRAIGRSRCPRRARRGRGSASRSGSTRSPRPTPPSSSCRPSSMRGPRRRTAPRRWRATDSAPPSTGWDGAIAPSPPTRPPSRRRPPDDPDEVRTKARDAIARAPDHEDGGGLPAVARGLSAAAAERAGAAPRRACRDRPRSTRPTRCTTYRQALLLAARGRQADALAAFERVDRAAPDAAARSSSRRRRSRRDACSRPRATARARSSSTRARPACAAPTGPRERPPRRRSSGSAPPAVALTPRAIDARRSPRRGVPRRRSCARRHFVLDINSFSPIIYILYERGGT